MGNQIQTYNDPVLQSIIRGYSPKDNDYIHMFLFPTINVKSRKGDIQNVGTEFLRTSSKLMVSRSGTPEITVSMSLTDGWSCEINGAQIIITNQDGEKFDPLDRDAGKEEARTVFAKMLKCAMWLAREKEASDACTSTSIITNNTTLSGSSQWSDFAGSDPLGDFKLGQDTIYDAIGLEANTAYMSRAVFRSLRFHPQIFERIGVNDTANKLKGASQDQLAMALDVDRVLVGRARYESAKEGQTSSMANVWGKDCGLLYVNPTPTPTEYEFSFGYNFQMQEPSVDYGNLIDPRGAEFVRYEDDRDQLILKATAAYLIKSAVA